MLLFKFQQSSRYIIFLQSFFFFLGNFYQEIFQLEEILVVIMKKVKRFRITFNMYLLL